MTSSADGQDRLQEIWDAWGLTRDEPMSKAQLGALQAVSSWVAAGQTDPETMIRAVQLLLADPERTDMRQRACWTGLRKAVQKEWPSASAVIKDHLRFAQALLLIAWPAKVEGWLIRASLLDSAWELRQGEEPKEVAQWRINHVVKSAHSLTNEKNYDDANERKDRITQFKGIKWEALTSLTEISEAKRLEIQGAVSHLVPIARDHAKAIMSLSDTLTEVASGVENIRQEFVGQTKITTAVISVALDEVRDKLNLLWWGQSRYCRALRKPYLRLKSDPAALLWWTAREASELSLSVDVEPAAAYLVETLHNLGQGIDDKKTVLVWMEEFYKTLRQAGDKVPTLSERLDKIAKEDALGLPVTWVRQRVMRKDEFDPQAAKEAIALQLDEEIDRGDWASWIFRETLLDLHLASPQ